MRSHPTIVDVARAAGVAVGTASDALNGKGRMSAATRERVIEAAAELGFHHDRLARGLQSGRKMAIGLRFDHEVAIPPGSFFVELLNSAAATAGRSGYGLLISTREVDESDLVDGLIIVDPAEEAGIDALIAAELPVVTVGRARGPAAPWVDIDHGEALSLLLDHLATKDRDPAAEEAWLVSLEEKYSFVEELEAAFGRWCEKRRMRPRVLASREQAPTAAAAVTAALAGGPPPALIATAVDGQALGVHRALAAAGLGVALGSAADSRVLEWLDPPVSAVALGAANHGTRAVTMVLDWMRLGERPQSSLLPAGLIAR